MAFYGLCLSLSDSLHLVWLSLGPSMLANGIFSFFLWVSILLCVCVYIYIYIYFIYIHTHHILFIHSSVYGCLSCFHVLAIVNSAAVNIEEHVSFWIIVFFGYGPRVRLKDHMPTLLLVFWGTTILFSTMNILCTCFLVFMCKIFSKA